VVALDPQSPDDEARAAVTASSPATLPTPRAGVAVRGLRLRVHIPSWLLFFHEVGASARSASRQRGRHAQRAGTRHRPCAAADATSFVYPSSIAAYGLFDLSRSKAAAQGGRTLRTADDVRINKLYCEKLGGYYERFYRQLDAQIPPGRLRFRAVRFPGLISADTVPTGGTSDYAPEMLHAAAAGKPYTCFVRGDTRIPFMAMPDAIEALLHLEEAPYGLPRDVYNVGSFSPTTAEIHERVKRAFPDAQVTFQPDLKRQGIVDSWPLDVDDSAARKDWRWRPVYDFERAFEEYLIPAVRKRYRRG
jgi:nucleoside-diphosphate-sugar epimerase